MRKCQTPDAIYHFNITDSSVNCSVDIPFKLNLTEQQAVKLENELHDALETVLKQFFNLQD
jgi:hypothetical protein